MTKFVVHLTIEGTIETCEEVKLPLTENLGKRLKELRLANKLTMRKLSQLSGVSLSEIGRIEQGARTPNSLIIGKLERALEQKETK